MSECPGRKKGFIHALKTIPEGEVFVAASTARPRSGLPSGGKTDRRSRRSLAAAARWARAKLRSSMAVILKTTNEDASQTQKPIYTFGVYLEQVFLPLSRRNGRSQHE
jgi:hypothetical protein